ncbi:FtsX-like permease family protein [Bailinhaonella thermotolerans]|uniref:ABC transporter permease n=1 Tax=Bailinhaonella thermotolerans TaxID=1070861 RepID=A0A3A4AL23_9ACTN|nr:ABC transporter permease [Bailinhaonella thermotolerans]RJL26483.1 ABC transporter permease [Bailinhaonella thermotolerans]
MRGRSMLVLRRALSEPLLVLAAAVSVLLATTVLVALTTYATSVVDAGVRRALAEAPPSRVSSQVTASVEGPSLPSVDAEVRRAATAAHPGARLEISLTARSESYAAPGQQRLERPELVRFGFRDDLQRHARLVSGRWAAPVTSRGDRLEVTVSEGAARALGVRPGSELTMERRTGEVTTAATVVGVYTLTRPGDPRWADDALMRTGEERGDFTTFGPLMVPRETFQAQFAEKTPASWTITPDLSSIGLDRLRSLSDAASGLEGSIRRMPDCSSCGFESELPEMLAQLERATLVSRSTMLVPVLQLLLLAGYALLLTARLLTDHRRMEVALMRSRGAGTSHIVRWAFAESLLLAAPSVVLAPLLAPPLLDAVSAVSGGVRVENRVDGVSFALAAGAALICGTLLALPALAGSRRTYSEEQAARGRGERRGLVQRAGADLALLVIAGIALWQLRTYGGPVTETAGGLGVDPLIVTGPALALLCGGLLALRLVPWVGRAAERMTSRRPGLPAVLGAWQVSRRPLRYSGPVLLLVMAIAIGLVSVATTATWHRSQADQADHQAGADLRVTVPPGTDRVGILGRSSLYASLPGVTAVSPLHRGDLPPEGDGDRTTLLAADAAVLDQVLRLRPDLSDRPLRELVRPLAAERPRFPVVPLPGRPERLEADLRLSAPADATVSALVMDGQGVNHRVPLPVPEPDDRVHRVSVDLARLAGPAGRVAYPLALRGFVVDAAPERRTRLSIGLPGADGGTLRLPDGSRWTFGRLGMGGGTVSDGGLITLDLPAAEGRAYRGATVLLAGRDTRDTDVFPASDAQAPTVPGVVTAELAAGQRLGVGGVLPLDAPGIELRVRIAGIVESMPAVPAGRGAVLIDLPTLQLLDLRAGDAPHDPGEWLAAARDGGTAAAAALAGHPEWAESVTTRDAVRAHLRDDPLTGGLKGALALGFAAALAFAALGFLVNAAVSARERAGEFAVLRAMGVSFRQVFGLLAVEQAFVAGLSIFGGVALAIVITLVVVPYIVLTGQATVVSPPVLTELPPLAAAALLLGVLALLTLIVAGLARSLRRRGLGDALRMGDDR